MNSGARSIRQGMFGVGMAVAVLALFLVFAAPASAFSECPASAPFPEAGIAAGEISPALAFRHVAASAPTYTLRSLGSGSTLEVLKENPDTGQCEFGCFVSFRVFLANPGSACGFSAPGTYIVVVGALPPAEKAVYLLTATCKPLGLAC